MKLQGKVDLKTPGRGRGWVGPGASVTASLCRVSQDQDGWFILFYSVVGLEREGGVGVGGGLCGNVCVSFTRCLSSPIMAHDDPSCFALMWILWRPSFPPLKPLTGDEKEGGLT